VVGQYEGLIAIGIIGVALVVSSFGEIK